MACVSESDSGVVMFYNTRLDAMKMDYWQEKADEKNKRTHKCTGTHECGQKHACPWTNKPNVGRRWTDTPGMRKTKVMIHDDDREKERNTRS